MGQLCRFCEAQLLISLASVAPVLGTCRRRINHHLVAVKPGFLVSLVSIPVISAKVPSAPIAPPSAPASISGVHWLVILLTEAGFTILNRWVRRPLHASFTICLLALVIEGRPCGCFCAQARRTELK